MDPSKRLTEFQAMVDISRRTEYGDQNGDTDGLAMAAFPFPWSLVILAAEFVLKSAIKDNEDKQAIRAAILKVFDDLADGWDVPVLPDVAELTLEAILRTSLVAVLDRYLGAIDEN
tara:strand:+ start:3723 stop:4070 length:348 start_codon:yes stop_codon:yes gene_type:complete